MDSPPPPSVPSVLHPSPPLPPPPPPPATNRERLVLQRLQYEVADHPAVIVMHPRPVRVEDAGDPHTDVRLLLVGDGQSLRHTFGLIIAGTGT